MNDLRTDHKLSQAARLALGDAVEDAIEDFCYENGVNPLSVPAMSGVYARVLVHALWAMSDLGIDREELVKIATAAANDAANAIEAEDMSNSRGGLA